MFTAVGPGARDVQITKALDRIAETIERLSIQLDAYHHEQAAQFDAIEFPLREIVIGTVWASATRPVVLGGVIDPAAADRHGSEITVIPNGYPLRVDTAVEVRSRFQDHWVGGFAVAEAIETPHGCRYRLTRRSDGNRLPILFDACDIRATAIFDRQSVD
jgi:hypothetical protein